MAVSEVEDIHVEAALRVRGGDRRDVAVDVDKPALPESGEVVSSLDVALRLNAKIYRYASFGRVRIPRELVEGQGQAVRVRRERDEGLGLEGRRRR